MFIDEIRNISKTNNRKEDKIILETIEYIKNMICNYASRGHTSISITGKEQYMYSVVDQKILKYFKIEGFSVIVSATHCVIPGCGRNVYSSPDIKLEIVW